jgi:hypothetical protein
MFDLTYTNKKIINDINNLNVKLTQIDSYIFTVESLLNLNLIFNYITNKTKKAKSKYVDLKITQYDNYYYLNINTRSNKLLILFIRDTKKSRMLNKIYKHLYFYERSESVMDNIINKNLNN